ncbi:MAG TPA: hypothetical protein VLE73_06425 [Candidatus Saccharimonadales bacterium]|nr:hypothetical protein [Candidatus Saccharimonadales bacterium]
MIQRLFKKPLPENFADVYMSSNQHYPQIDTALIFGTGAVAIDAILSNELRVTDLPRLQATKAQVAATMERVANLHKAFAIPMPIANKPLPNNERAVTPKRVRTLMSDGWRDGVRLVGANYSAATLPEVPALPEQYIAYSLPNKLYPKAERTAYNELLRQGPNGSFRPELVAFGGLLREGATILADEPARDAARAYRKNYSALYAPDITRPEWDDIAQRITEFRPVLQGMLQEGLVHALPDISDRAGYNVPPDAVGAIVQSAVAWRTNLPVPPSK